MRHFLFLLLLAIVLLMGCSEGLKGVESEYVIKVTGSDKLEFSGHYTIAGPGTIPKPISVKGVVPIEYKSKGTAAACVIRKTSAEGQLKVEILKGQGVVSSAETAAPFGIITLGKIPDAQSIINRVIGIILG